jgi:hypothetical protein
VIVAVTMVRDEEDVIGHTLELMLSQVDHVIVADNLSVDGTRDILESFDRVTVLDDPVVAYTQADKMTALAHQAGAMGAEWVVPFDADEAWWLPDFSTITADVIATRPHVYVPQPGDSPNPLTWQHRLPEPERQNKVAFRYHPDAALHMGQHDVYRPGPRVDAGRCRHYQYRSLEQVRRKVSNGVGAYNASSLPALYGSHWRELNVLDDEGLAKWWDEYVNQPLVFDP